MTCHGEPCLRAGPSASRSPRLSLAYASGGGSDIVDAAMTDSAAALARASRTSAHPRPACRRAAEQRHRATPIRCWPNRRDAHRRARHHGVAAVDRRSARDARHAARASRPRKAKVPSRAIRPAAHRGRDSSSSVKLSLPTWGSVSVEWQRATCEPSRHAPAARVESTRRRPSLKATPVFLRRSSMGTRTRSNAWRRRSPFAILCKNPRWCGVGPVFGSRHANSPMQWTTTAPMWPTGSPLDMPARLQAGITDTFADGASVGDSNPRAASLPRPTDSEMVGVYWHFASSWRT
jgi:hypothetical protein